MPKTQYNNPLGELAALLWDETKQRWYARARNCNDFVFADDPEEAILLAIKQRDERDPK